MTYRLLSAALLLTSFGFLACETDEAGEGDGDSSTGGETAGDGDDGGDGDSGGTGASSGDGDQSSTGGAGGDSAGGASSGGSGGAGGTDGGSCSTYGEDCLTQGCCDGLICDGESSACNILEEGVLGPDDVCTGDAQACAPGLVCCYPCGQVGCEFTCTTPCSEGEPGCFGGCFAFP